ncbi:hypothetical protein [Caproicibacter fermentans]|uniref:Uncharacterized protein n=1 Tax=Caproicibacter fermentans TaxID=2576756 RepID=A0A7G8TCA4_9FIRM|nr:hypothetical protein [Caproicibacter fermentans]QNK41245.1 hypothetical protein HCR03_02770 [Caproicibacter fermentans]
MAKIRSNSLLEKNGIFAGKRIIIDSEKEVKSLGKTIFKAGQSTMLPKYKI